jgi:hypothetical protein
MLLPMSRLPGKVFELLAQRADLRCIPISISPLPPMGYLLPFLLLLLLPRALAAGAAPAWSRACWAGWPTCSTLTAQVQPA